MVTSVIKPPACEFFLKNGYSRPTLGPFQEGGAGSSQVRGVLDFQGVARPFPHKVNLWRPHANPAPVGLVEQNLLSAACRGVSNILGGGWSLELSAAQ